MADGNADDWPVYGIWVMARHSGDCTGCGTAIEPGDQIRSDLEGGWLCGLCGDEGGGIMEVRDVDVRYL